MRPKNNNWTFEREVVLIDFYAKHRCMWAPAEPEHKAEKKHRMAELVEILQNVFTGDDIHARFITLRSTFRMNYRRVIGEKRGRVGDGGPYVPTWPHYNSLQFLTECFTECPPRTTATPPPSSPTDEFSHIISSPRDEIAHNTSYLPHISQSPTETQAVIQRVEDDDIHSAFGVMVAHSLREMEDFPSAMAKLEIQQVLVKYHRLNPANHLGNT